MCSYSSARTCSLSTRLSPSMCDVNTGLTNRPRSPVSGWTRTTGWRTGASAATRSPAVVVLEAVERPRRVVDRDERIDERADARRQRAVGGDEVGPQRVAADGGDLLGGQDRRQRRARRERDVGVPAVVVAGTRRRGRRCRGGSRGCRARGSRDGRRRARPAAGGPASASPKRRPNATCWRRRDVLVAEEHDAPAQQRAADRRDRGVVERRRQVGTVQHGADRAGQRFDEHRGRRDISFHVAEW